MSILFLLLFVVNTVCPVKVDIYKRPQNVERSRDYDALHYKLEFKFDVKNKTYRGKNTITLMPLRDNFRECILDAEGFTVTSVSTPENTPLQFKQTDKQLVVTLSKTYNYKEKLSFIVDYFEKNSQAGLKFIDEAPGHPAQITTYSWPEKAHHWFPCFDFPNDKVTNELIAEVDSHYKVLSNGRLVNWSENKKNNTVTYHWSQEKPHPTCLIMMAAGPFEVIEDSLGPLPVNYWVYKKDVPDAKRIFKKTPAVIAFFNKAFAFAYPWAKYDQVCLAGIGGGLETTSATTLGDRTIRDAVFERDYPVFDLIVHELAHQWWGDTVTERTWSHVWLSESFATYSEYLFKYHNEGPDEAAVDLLEKKNRYLWEAKNRYMRPLVFNRYNTPWNIMDGHSYPKGAVILHMLRFVMGDKPFFRSLSHFLHKHAFGVADSHDFSTAIKEAAGQNVDWFFDQWLFKPGHPVFDIKYRWVDDKKKIVLTITQTQDTAIGVPVYTLPVNIGIVTPGGKSSKKIWIKKREEVLELAAGQKPLLVRFDEGNHLLKEWTFEKDLDELIYQLGHDDMIGRMWAAGEILRFKEDMNALMILAASAGIDACVHVRKAAVETIGKLKLPNLTHLLKTLANDPESKVRAEAITALANYKESGFVPLFIRKFKQDDSVLVRVTALHAIGKCGNKTHIPFLKKIANDPSQRKFIKRAAEYALKKINPVLKEKPADKKEK